MTHVILDHSIVGQSATSLEINKERRYAGCRICGRMFQPDVLRQREFEPSLLELLNAEVEISDWREAHNKTHSHRVHESFRASGLAFAPDAAMRLATFGIVAVDDALVSAEVAQALFEAPRAPIDDVDGSLKGYM